jgi:hypothetical protein
MHLGSWLRAASQAEAFRENPKASHKIRERILGGFQLEGQRVEGQRMEGQRNEERVRGVH